MLSVIIRLSISAIGIHRGLPWIHIHHIYGQWTWHTVPICSIVIERIWLVWSLILLQCMLCKIQEIIVGKICVDLWLVNVYWNGTYCLAITNRGWKFNYFISCWTTKISDIKEIFHCYGHARHNPLHSANNISCHDFMRIHNKPCVTA